MVVPLSPATVGMVVSAIAALVTLCLRPQKDFGALGWLIVVSVAIVMGGAGFFLDQ